MTNGWIATIAGVAIVAATYGYMALLDFRFGQRARRRGWFIHSRWSWFAVRGWQSEDMRIRDARNAR